MLATARQEVLRDALLPAVAAVDPNSLSAEIIKYVPSKARQALQAAGIRDEHVFALPSVLEQRPTLLGYYRLLLGVSQKQFYHARTGLRRFKVMETGNTIRPADASHIGDVCSCINEAMAEMITGIEGGVTPQDVEQLPFLMLGAQFDGSWRTQIGSQATKGVFSALKEIIDATGTNYLESEDGYSLTLLNSSGRKITVALAADPDVVIVEDIQGTAHTKVAIEIKGGTDQSNAHNRAGEAEKSHQKARLGNAGDFWTIISIAGMDLNVLKQESPTTRQWFDVTEVQKREGAGWGELASAVMIAIGI
ncbi:hypothetical protein J2Y41_004578 [Arthrobacter sp. 1088]|uniref:XcyI family restriction endonuclease n=1 Tax=Arthrobacter sp. 1088 TaxID=2817768 RepID=UPI00285A320D|nr:XcyI family restriction endonuclease [Arthrobacter sp. 1088]MDR6688978.1 hypothetical protein [Arthrobacter sp. 1088]